MTHSIALSTGLRRALEGSLAAGMRIVSRAPSSRGSLAGAAPSAEMHAVVVAAMQHINNAIDAVAGVHAPGVAAADILAAVDVLGSVFNSHLPEQVRSFYYFFARNNSPQAKEAQPHALRTSNEPDVLTYPALGLVRRGCS